MISPGSIINPMDQSAIQNPFANLKIRTLVFILLATSPFLILTIFIAKHLIGFSDALVETLATTIWFYGIILAWMWYQFKRHGISWKKLTGGLPNNFNWLANIVLLLCLLLFNFGSLFASLGLLSFIFPDFVLSFLNDKQNTDSLSPQLFLIFDTVSAILLAPIVEELLMRGVFLHRFQFKWGIQKAIIIGAIIFAIGHSNIIGMFMVALIMSILYLKYKTLLVPMFFHAMNNTAVSLLQLSQGGQTDSKSATLSDIQSALWIGIVLLIISLPVLLQFLIKNWPRKEDQKNYLILPYFANSNSKISL